MEHFKSMNTVNPLSNDYTTHLPDSIAGFNKELNMPFTTEEVTAAIAKLKNSKACGNDLILNEFIKYMTSVVVQF